VKSIRFEHVYKRYDKSPVIEDLNLSFESGERVVLLGPSGCGKTTTLRMISGLEDISSGNLYMGGRIVNDVESGDRNVAMVFQNYALFPHMTVFKNIAFGLRTYRLPKGEIKVRVGEIMRILELQGLEERLPRQLSGGQRQRVALARAVVKRADYFLLDEPLSNLDAQLRMQARKELVKLHEIYHPTFVYVTHDQIEAMTIGQKVVLMYKGVVQMADTPYNIYHRPANVFTARFIGSPPMNVVEVPLEDGRLVLGGRSVPLGDEWAEVAGESGAGRVKFGMRPEDVRLTATPRGAGIPITVKYVESYGNKVGAYFDLDGMEYIAAIDEGVSPGSALYWDVDLEKISLFDAKTDRNLGYPAAFGATGGKTLDDAETLLPKSE
jgi:sn-glycerol 3-phosphate transport system ATP-binding protein